MKNRPNGGHSSKQSIQYGSSIHNSTGIRSIRNDSSLQSIEPDENATSALQDFDSDISRK